MKRNSKHQNRSHSQKMINPIYKVIKRIWENKFDLNVWANICLVAIGVTALLISRDTEQRQLRAYIGITIPQDVIDKSLLEGTIPEIRYVINNSGQTPAFNVVYWSTIGIFPYPLPPNFKFPKPVFGPATPLTIFPGTIDPLSIRLSLRDPLTRDDTQRIQAGTSNRLYTYGRILYKDAFNELHYTNFCYSFYNVTSLKVKYDVCMKHNDAN